VWCTKKGGNVPALLMDKEHSYVIVGRSILFKVPVNQLPEAVVAFLAAFYLLDIDYFKCHEIGMNVLQYCVFEDMNVPKILLCSLMPSCQNTKSSKTMRLIDSIWNWAFIAIFNFATKGLFM
jgi:hypothetical protein